ncbi:MAG: hypothetical protein JO125_07375 [Chloroflexi bacterium]|nr:hypothetical protein [Chloroflexota bacterium]
MKSHSQGQHFPQGGLDGHHDPLLVDSPLPKAEQLELVLIEVSGDQEHRPTGLLTTIQLPAQFQAIGQPEGVLLGPAPAG